MCPARWCRPGIVATAVGRRNRPWREIYLRRTGGAGRTENLLLSDIWRTGGNCVTVIRGLSFCPILHVANHPLMGPPGLAGSFVYGRSQAILANRTDDSHAQTRERE
jgi:hypothetical protein